MESMPKLDFAKIQNINPREVQHYNIAHCYLGDGRNIQNVLIQNLHNLKTTYGFA